MFKDAFTLMRFPRIAMVHMSQPTECIILINMSTHTHVHTHVHTHTHTELGISDLMYNY